MIRRVGRRRLLDDDFSRRREVARGARVQVPVPALEVARVACLPAAQRFKPEGFYHRMQVRHSKQGFNPAGPSVTFLPKEDSETLKQADLFDAL